MSTLDGDNEVLQVHSRLGAAGWRLLDEPARGRGALGVYERIDAKGKTRRGRLFLDDAGTLQFVESAEGKP